jgi:hypothetical protein
MQTAEAQTSRPVLGGTVWGAWQLPEVRFSHRLITSFGDMSLWASSFFGSF